MKLFRRRPKRVFVSVAVLHKERRRGATPAPGAEFGWSFGSWLPALQTVDHGRPS